MLRRLSGATVEERGSYLVIRTPDNPTFYWGNFLLFPEPPRHGEPEQWVASFAREFPDATHVSIGVDGVGGALGTVAEMRALGLTEDVGVVLTTERVVPWRERDPDLDLRVLRTDDEWAQSVEFRIAIDEDDSEQHREFVVRRARELRTLVEAGHGVYVGVFVDGVARSGLGLFAADGLARYQSVETHPDFRGRGFASALLVAAARLVSEQQSVERFVIVADPSYIAIDIYRRLGFQDTERQVQWLRNPG
jgi:ribosomal protein S18 acetylase RimI-like enzyme